MNSRQIITLYLLLTIVLGSVAFAQVVDIPDPNLRAAVRSTLDLPDETLITQTAMRRMTELDAADRGIADLTGLEFADNLTWLSIPGNQITDLIPIAGLTRLETLYMWLTPISDISPLANLTELRNLDAGGCRISDISPLENLTQLTRINLRHNRIIDIEPLAHLTRLKRLQLNSNRITDVSALAGIVSLESLEIHNNRIADHSPLDSLPLAHFIYDQACDMPRLPLSPRLENRTFPSIFAPWGRILNRPHLSNVERRSNHDLYVCCLMFGHQFLFTGLGWEVRGNHDNAARVRDDFLAHNPNMIFIAEVRMRDEGGGYPDPDSPDWVWVQDSQGNVVHHGDRRLINFTHPQVQDMIVQQAIAVSKCGFYDGIFLDWWNEYGGVLGDSIDNQIQQQARDDIIQRIRAATAPDFLIMVNTNRRKTPRNGPYINGSFMESLVPSDAPANHVEALLAEVESSLLWLDTNLKGPRVNSLEGWGVPTESPDSPTNLRWMRAFTTLSLTHSNGYVVFTKGRGHDHYWYDFWDADLGRPVGEKGQLYDEDIPGLYIREYTNGWAVYNHSGAEQTVALPELASGVASGSEGLEHTLPNLDGEMYLRVKPVNPADVNRDGIVNILDLTIVAQGLGTDNLKGDVNGDGVVNILDLVFVADQF